MESPLMLDGSCFGLREVVQLPIGSLASCRGEGRAMAIIPWHRIYQVAARQREVLG